MFLWIVFMNCLYENHKSLTNLRSCGIVLVSCVARGEAESDLFCFAASASHRAHPRPPLASPREKGKGKKTQGPLQERKTLAPRRRHPGPTVSFFI